jgi:hypothetical protein
MRKFTVKSKERAPVKYNESSTTGEPKEVTHKGWIYKIEVDGYKKTVVIQTLFELDDKNLSTIIDLFIVQDEKEKEENIVGK